MSHTSNYAENRTPTAPYLFLLRIPAGLRLVVALKEGDKAQKTTLKLLEDTQEIMPLYDHDKLHEKYDRLQTMRLRLGKRSFFPRPEQWEAVVSYRNGSLELKDSAKASSEVARSNQMWATKTLRHGRDPSSPAASRDADAMPQDSSDEASPFGGNKCRDSSSKSDSHAGPVSINSTVCKLAIQYLEEVAMQLGEDRVSIISLQSEDDVESLLEGSEVSGKSYGDPFNDADGASDIDTLSQMASRCTTGPAPQ